MLLHLFFVVGNGIPRDVHVLTHSFPTRRSSDLSASFLRIRHGVRAAAPPNELARLAMCKAPAFRPIDRQGRVGATAPPSPIAAACFCHCPEPQEAESVRIVPHDQPGYGQKCSGRSEEHTSELQSLMRNSYAVFCLKKKNNSKN